MASKIRVEVENATGSGLDEITRDANKASGAVDKLGDEARQTGQQVEKIGKAGESLKSLERLGKMVVSAQLLGTAIRGITSAVSELSDDGSPAFVELTEAAETAYHAMLDLGNDPIVQEWASSLASTIKDDLAPALKQIPGMIQGIHNELADWIAWAGEKTTLFPPGTLDELNEGQVRTAKLNEEKKKTIAIVRERVNVEEKLAALDRKLADETSAAAISNIDDQEVLNGLLRDEIDALRTLEKEGSRDTKAKESHLKTIENLKRQQMKLDEQWAADNLKRTEEASQKRYDIEKKFQDASAENKKIALNAEQEKLKAEQDEALKILEALGEMKGAKGGNAIDEAKQGLDKRKVLGQVAKGRGDKAEQEAIEIENAKGAKEGPYTTEAERTKGEGQRNARIAAARKAAERSAFADAKRGKLDGGEVNDAQSELINSGIQQANSTGKLGDTAAQFAQEAVRGLRDSANTAAEQQKQIDQLRQTLAGINGAAAGNAQKFRNQQGGRQG